jgi:hypothetical protein
MFVADEDAIAVGVRTMSAVLVNYLSSRPVDAIQTGN